MGWILGRKEHPAKPGKQFKISNHTPNYSGFLRLLFRWKGSIWKLVKWDMPLVFGLYILISVLYHTINKWPVNQQIIEKIKSNFEMICIYMDRSSGSWNAIFVIFGFYIEYILDKWWKQYTILPWPDAIFLKLLTATSSRNMSSSARLMRLSFMRQAMRYINLYNTLILRILSKDVQRRFPDNEFVGEEWTFDQG